MDTTTLLVVVSLVCIVGFFGFQWYQASQKTKAPAQPAKAAPRPPLREQMAPMAEPSPAPKLKLPEVPGQTEQELRAKEPLQRTDAPTPQKPVGPEARSVPAFDDNLRRPEQSFHAPPPSGLGQGQTYSDVAAGRAGPGGTSGNPPATHVQNFSPEMAQNGGPVVGSTVFAFDGAEPTGYASF